MRRVALLLFIALAAPTPAFAYKRSMTCDDVLYPCNGATPKPVQWATRCPSYYVNEDGTPDIPDFGTLLAATTASFDRWSNIPGAEFRLQYAGLTNEDRAEYDPKRGEDGNANVVLWRNDEWPYASRTAYAITMVTFLPSTGEIVNADIEVNTNLHQFSVGDENVRVDLENTLTHEVGHFLGLDHTTDHRATMYHEAPIGETTKRTLKQDDIDGFFAIYPITGDAVVCPVMPDYFERPKDGCCATSTPAPSPAALLLGVVLVGVQRRRERNKVVER